MLHPQRRRSSTINSHAANARGVTLAALAAFASLLLVQVSTSPVASKGGNFSATRSADRAHARMRGARSANSVTSFAWLAAPFATITVDRTDDAVAASACSAGVNDCSLRGAIAYANLNPGTTISVPAGNYNLNIPGGVVEGFNGDNSIGDLDITANNTSIVGAGAASTIIHQAQPNDRVIEINPFLDAGFVASISDVSITGGRETTAVGGGGIISGSIDNTLTLSNCIVSGNSATGAGTFGGGGVSHSGGSLIISNCTFNNNSTSGSGGAIGYSAGDPFGRTPSTGTLTISGSTFSSNTANSASAGGGALDLFNFNQGTGSYNISSSSFSGNNATAASGGAIVVESGPLTVTTSAFTSNHAGSSGGAIMSAQSSAIAYSRLVGNTATLPANGNAMYRAAGTLTANDNWWGQNGGPAANDVQSSAGPIPPMTWLQLRHTASPDSICVGASSNLSADIRGRNAGFALTTELNGLPAFPASFVNGSPALGSVSGVTNFSDGQATAVFNATANGTANVDVTADNQTQSTSIAVITNTTSDPADQSVCEGGTASFTTTTSGPGSATYVWKQGSTVLNNGDLGGRVAITSGGSSSTLTITNVQAGDASSYTVEATGDCNTATQTAELSLQASTMATDPADAAVCQGATANFSTTASGTGPFNYAWTVDGNPAGSNSPNLSVPTGSLSTGTHSVEVTVTGTCGSATQTAVLTVQESTTTTDPADAAVCLGGTASFSTTASGTGPFTYSWTVDGAASGSDSPNLSFSTGALSVGDHTVVVTVTGACGTASQSATLTVQANTSATTPANQAVCKGGMASFSTTASGTGPFTYQWRVDGSDISGATNPSVTIDTTNLTGGNHTVDVVVSGTCETVTTSATLTVQTAPSVTLNPVSQTVTSGGNVTFTAAASGDPTPTVQWQVSTNGGGSFSDIPGATSTSLTFATNPSQNGNQYRAVFTNTCGSATTSAATLTTCTPASVTGSPASVADACVGSQVNFSASATGFPTPTVQWQVSTDGGASYSNIPGATSTTLSVTATVALRNSLYRAVFTNDCGTDTTAAATLGVDTIAPVIILNNNTISLWPPNHSYQTISVTGLVAAASDNCSSDLLSSVVIASVSSDEAENGNGDGNTSNDIIIAADCKSVQLRAERQNNGNGRVYRVNFKVTDTAGNVSTATAKVYVPKSQNGAAAVDDGPGAGYTVNSNCP